MKKNTFYLVIGCISILLLVLFWFSVERKPPFVIEAAFIVSVAFVYFLRSKVVDLKEDERDVKISEQAMKRTMQIFWVVFCAFSIGAVIQILRVPMFSSSDFPPPVHPPPIAEMVSGPPPLLTIMGLGFIQLGLLCLMIFLYVGFRMYYARKYGEWETEDEEQ
jgi:uncharacterized membrane protein